ncbi:CbiQ family ECF transporter T component [Streptosporangium nondiastaticum]|uniref:CbiQ family ECF transporter T component n=1 Tax=Streptosporangium nondiastaticum TaxID=35764 RepID=UPI002570DCB4|nr:CbiQ family ECF transporter T component [Streptosporangium nondiastaticum]
MSAGKTKGPAGAPLTARASALHAGAWWVWALGLATAASRTTNVLLLGLLVAVAGYVVAARRTDAPWARSYGAFLKLGLAVIGIRLVFAVVLGSPVPGTHTLVTLPEVPLPDWAQGVRIGGRVTAEGLVFALADGMKLATLLVCVGAANALANPARLLKSLPGALYEAGVAVVVAMTFAPNLVADVQRLRAARRLRGRPDRGLAALLQVGLPVLEGALERSVALAASMDARGYGRTAKVPRAVRRTTSALTLGGLMGVCAGTYGLLADQGAGYGLPVLLAGLAAALAGLWLGGRRSVRTRYRPDRWGVRAWLVSGSGVAVAALMIRANSYAPEVLHPSAVPLTAPRLPVWPAASVLLGLLPAFVAPGASGGGSGNDSGPEPAGHRRAGRWGPVTAAAEGSPRPRPRPFRKPEAGPRIPRARGAETTTSLGVRDAETTASPGARGTETTTSPEVRDATTTPSPRARGAATTPSPGVRGAAPGNGERAGPGPLPPPQRRGTPTDRSGGAEPTTTSHPQEPK